MNSSLTDNPKVVGFLQNPWFPPDTNPNLIAAYRADEGIRRVVLARTMTGRRLKAAFGANYYRIWWDNANPLHGDAPESSMPADMLHIQEVISCIKPKLIITFGRTASLALTDPSLDLHGAVVSSAHHPNARGKTQEDLNQFAAYVNSVMMTL